MTLATGAFGYEDCDHGSCENGTIGFSIRTFNASKEGASTNNKGVNIYTDNGELRPENYTVCIWLRTA